MDQDLSRPSPRAGAVIRWEPHGRLITACLVALNVFLVLLVYVYFWRYFSRARGGGDEGKASSAASSPPASPKARDRREVERAITSLPVFVHSPADDGGASAVAECAICIAEFAAGEEGRLLPRRGHRFHARCVDAWFRFQTTCPLCCATVLAVADGGATGAHDERADVASYGSSEYGRGRGFSGVRTSRRSISFLGCLWIGRERLAGC